MWKVLLILIIILVLFLFWYKKIRAKGVKTSAGRDSNAKTAKIMPMESENTARMAPSTITAVENWDDLNAVTPTQSTATIPNLQSDSQTAIVPTQAERQSAVHAGIGGESVSLAPRAAIKSEKVILPPPKAPKKKSADGKKASKSKEKKQSAKKDK